MGKIRLEMATSKDRVWAEAKAKTVRIRGKRDLFEISRVKDKAVLKRFDKDSYRTVGIKLKRRKRHGRPPRIKAADCWSARGKD